MLTYELPAWTKSGSNFYRPPEISFHGEPMLFLWTTIWLPTIPESEPSSNNWTCSVAGEPVDALGAGSFHRDFATENGGARST